LALQAQYGGEEAEQLAFDRPESWAMKYFTSVTLLTGIGVPNVAEKCSVDLAFESGWIPGLSASHRRVGFNGTKTEDVNRSPLLGRIRARVGVGAGVTVEAAYVPPVELDGAKPNLLAISVARPLASGPEWRLGARAFAQFGSIEGDFTCSRDEIGSPRDPAFNCLEASNDEISQRYLGAEVGIAGGSWLGPLEPHLTVGLSYLDMEFQVRARYNDVVDQTLFVTDGFAVFGTAGIGYRLSEALDLSGEVFYSPLYVEGRDRGIDGVGEARGSHGLLNARAMVSYRVR